ncbi:SRPBCC family protein [Actinomycetospora endophytica]|uniref:SRPBCC family protein n=1 Tax=Actinomycetospora endophytica TaxID=2291215 RepID=A0ABS8P4A1_9PSEU|nr:SRPBCC family protein [Actinomycetospora endophytica]MCD2193056.1 SRPBCC family protein [Actinomycetospora endophytica]
MRTTVSARGPATADEAWERYADLDRWRGWAPQITAVRAPARRLEPGLRGTVHAVGVVRVPFEVLAVDEAARTWSWRVRVGPLHLVLHHDVEPDDGGSRTRLVTEGPALVVAPYTPIAFVALHALVAPPAGRS